MSKADRYVKLVAWSDEDCCFIGSCPELFYRRLSREDAKAVREGKPLPEPMSGPEFVNALSE